MKERVSFFEIAFREFYEDVQLSNKELAKRALNWEIRRAKNSGLLVWRPENFYRS